MSTGVNPVEACEDLLYPSLIPQSRDGVYIGFRDPEPTRVSRMVGAGFILGLGCIANVEQLWQQYVALQQQ